MAVCRRIRPDQLSSVGELFRTWSTVCADISAAMTISPTGLHHAIDVAYPVIVATT
jgi:hypothetical protein